MTNEPVSDAKQTLLRALDAIDAVEEEMGAEVRYLCVSYSIFKDDEDGSIHDKGGWNHSTAPAWLISALLRHTAKAIEESVSPDEDDDEE